jgi:hypothetical protein
MYIASNLALGNSLAIVVIKTYGYVSSLTGNKLDCPNRTPTAIIKRPRVEKVRGNANSQHISATVL